MSINRRTDRPATPQGEISKFAASQVSEMRRAEITNAVNSREAKASDSKASATIAHSPSFKKTASISSPQGPLTTSTKNDTMSPEVFSPLFLLANLNLPRDRVTMNAWNRIYYDTNPIVRNAINLHSSYPISKINIGCKNKKVQQFFMEWAEKIDLYSVVYGVAMEYWKLGEAFPYSELDQSSGTWKRITVLNPDYVHVKRSVIGDQTIISLRPDATLQRLVGSTDPSDLAMKSRLPPHILDYVRRNQNIPLDNFNVSHLKLLSAPYDIRGTSIIVSVYKDLMLLDKIRESKFAQADGMINPLTLVKVGGTNEYRATQSDLEAFRTVMEEAQYDKDFKLVTAGDVTIERVGFSGSVLEVTTDLEFIMNNLYNGLMAPKVLFEAEGSCHDEDETEILSAEQGWIKIGALKDGEKIATCNLDTDTLEFHAPTSIFRKEHTGLFYNIKNVDIDVAVTDYHEMLADDYHHDRREPSFRKIRALDLFDIADINSDKEWSCRDKKNKRFKTSVSNFAAEPNNIMSVVIPEMRQKFATGDKTIDIDLFLEFSGYFLSEGSLMVRGCDRYAGDPRGISITQLPKSKGYIPMKSCMERMPYHAPEYGIKHNRNSWHIMDKPLATFFLKEFGFRSHDKFIPTWIKNLPKDKLDIILYAMYLGDGSCHGHSTHSADIGSYLITTVSRKLADDIQEIALKCGYFTKVTTKQADPSTNRREKHTVFIIKSETKSRAKMRKSASVVRPSDASVSYVVGKKVFCVEVENHLFITRRNGKIGIHGNSYASSSVGLEVLRQRYDIFRNMLKKWLERKIFAPICELQDFFEYENGEKKLQVPTIDFNHMNLYDLSDYINAINTYVGAKQISLQTLHRSLGLSYEEENKRLREESIHEAIFNKEKAILAGMRLSELLALDPEKAITEPPEETAPVGPEGGEDGGMPGLPGMSPSPGPSAPEPSGPPPSAPPSEAPLGPK